MFGDQHQTWPRRWLPRGKKNSRLVSRSWRARLVGGMLETGIGRAANLALAALPGFTLPGDISTSARYFARDITTPFVLDQGQIAVPNTVGIGVAPLPEMLAGFKKVATFEVAKR